MKVAVLFSGGKDSVFAVDHCLSKGWDIQYLLSVKPSRRDCYLFHFATVEHTKYLADALGIPHILVGCDVADPKLEAQIVREVIEKNPVDAVILGGVGLQETQLRSVRDALFDLGIEVFAAHKDEDEELLMRRMIADGYEIVMTEIASDGLTAEWLGKTLTLENFEQLKVLSKKFGFDLLGEGGYYNSLVVDGPIFTKKLVIKSSEKVMEAANSGFLLVHALDVIAKLESIYHSRKVR
ncbi:MAG: diphthine--ammonia ligase [Nanoarchaeota archaeon]|nr:diphthine--ammonia ligase [Nanoarchaeota archaeon]